VPIPALTGLAVNDAKNALTAVGLTSRVIYLPSTSQAGTVIDSDPQEGQEVPPGSRVTLVVAASSTSSPTPVASANRGG
jgi:beta-lactam-binding protein with PASTA domain